MIFWRFFIILSFIGLADAAAGQSPEQAIDFDLKRIQQTQRALDNNELQKNNELASLRQLERERRQLETELDQIKTSLKLNKSAFSGLNKVKDQLRDKLETQVTLLKKLTIVAYTLHKDSWLKILFHIEDTDQWYRNLAYYSFITAYQLSLSAQTDAHMKIQEKLLKELIQTGDKIKQQQSLLNKQLTRLKGVEQERQTVIADIGSSIQKGERQLAQLNAKLQRVDKLATDLGNLQWDEMLVEEADFSSLRGNLPLPAKGKIQKTFRKKSNAVDKRSGLHHKGLVIETQYGSPVKAVARGNVVFADWLRGFGLVIILDHGNNFLSLYAHNRQFSKQVGDWVNSGEIISMVGETGGRNKPELYFELRHKSVALNPELWLKMS